MLVGTLGRRSGMLGSMLGRGSGPLGRRSGMLDRGSNTLGSTLGRRSGTLGSVFVSKAGMGNGRKAALDSHYQSSFPPIPTACPPLQVQAGGEEGGTTGAAYHLHISVAPDNPILQRHEGAGMSVTSQRCLI